jgi:xanthine dehydrogenase accessory factor
MSGVEQLLGALDSAVLADDAAVLATVVRVEGSAYRRPGARMLITALGQTEGTLSGGCLESEVARTAFWLTEQGSALRSYSTSDEAEDGEVAVSFGLGCNGKVHILFERVSAESACLLLEALRAQQRDGQARAVATVITPSPYLGERLLWSGAGGVSGQLPAHLRPALAGALQQAIARRCTSLHCLDQGGKALQVLVEYLPPVRRLVVFGGGHDAQPVVRMARLLGWQVTVIDSRAHFARASRFPEAHSVLLGALDDSFNPAALLQEAAVVIMTHSLQQDAHWLDCALRSDAVYIGQLGPRERTERLLGDLAPVSDQARTRLYYPVGLDLGGDTPESVAMAMLSEMTAVLNGRQGGMLKARTAAIHDAAPVYYHQADADSSAPAAPLSANEIP